MRSIQYLLALLLFLFTLPALSGKLYKWKDANGAVHFSQTPPIDQQEQGSEEIALQAEKRGDEQCCRLVRTIIGGMLGRRIPGLVRREYDTYDIDLVELEKFVSNKARARLSEAQIGEIGFKTCMNAKFRFCRAEADGGLADGTGGDKKSKPASRSGSGFLVSRTGHVLTNEHVAGSCRRIKINPQGQEATLIARDKKNDLALVKIDTRSAPSVVFRTTGPMLGEDVVVAGFPYKGLLSSDIKISTGIVSSLSGIKNDERVVQITAPVQPGNSGGPLIDIYGNVIGVVASKLNARFMFENFEDLPQNINFAVNGQKVMAFLKENNIKFRTGVAGKKREVTEISEAAQGYSVQIDCEV